LASIHIVDMSAQKNVFEQLILPSYFPQTRKECKEITNTFFNCFSKEGKQQPNVKDDLDAARRGLQKCKDSMKAYVDCMDKVLAKEKSKQISKK